MYYQATDKALEDLLETCGWCTHVLVTNSDNGYHPNFLRDTLGAGRDLVAVDFVTQGEALDVNIGVGGIDLGAVLVSRRALELIRGYLPALPEAAKAKDVHDADYWFVRRGVDLGCTTKLIHEVLFYHH